jgi:hypothetical protein
MKDDCTWLNFRWALDVMYVNKEEAPLLRQLCKKYGLFWDGEYFYKIQSVVILRWPDWRNKYRIDMEKVVQHYGLLDPHQTKLLEVVGV